LIEEKNKKTLLNVRLIGELGMIPFYLVGGPVVGLWIGDWVDLTFGIAPYCRVIFVTLGMISGMRECWRVILRIAEK
jgi:F0F1-type ATP synthase assembly protein I